MRPRSWGFLLRSRSPACRGGLLGAGGEERPEATPDEIERQLADIVPFAGLNSKTLHRIRESGAVQEFEAAEVEGVFFHVILAGSADVIAGSQGMTTCALPEYSFKELLQKHAEIALPMRKVLAARLRRADS